ncbi:cytochrome P450 alkane hydroxylase-like protein [Mollisia scopiformis]|uniref:Cytochrome P450 alkane hydroxylase-like protein n=1 Tax=Mollisia scopiformis TaxID=149040 RepID=A0A132BBW2_MOLSC|nr:cytochrome P450 alkane hydroxylase-like protein [Mollisia scopiformis]KUJ09334.1 cytochrome P450 alkane hydroxylase-like protein [Mollisia scopiformis]
MFEALLSWSGLASTFALVPLFYVASWGVKELRYRVAAGKAGCATPAKYWHKDPFLGLDLFIKRITDMQAGDSLATDRILLDTYGKTVLTNNWGVKQYVTMDSANMQTILATQVDKFGNAPLNHKMCEAFLGDGIITMDGHAWKRSRQLLNPVFTRAQVSELSSFEVHVGKMMSKIPRDGSMVDMQPLCKMLFLDSSTEFIFGKSANTLSSEADNSVARRLSTLFDESLQTMFKRFMLGRFRFLLGEKQWLQTCAEVHSIIDGFIDEEVQAQKSAKSTSTDSDIPYNYVLLKELVKETDDKRFIRNELMNVYFPARDTAGILTSNIIFMLARHPDVWNKLREEVLSIGDQKLTFELLKSLKYVHAVISETLRLQSPIGGSWKTCLSPCILPHGGGASGQDPILLEPGDEVRMSFTPMHTDPEIWGNDSEEFHPERFLGMKQSWNFIPFMGGRRICPAQQNVLTDVCYVLVRLAREFKAVERRDETLAYVDAIVFTRESKNGAKVAFVPAK